MTGIPGTSMDVLHSVSSSLDIVGMGSCRRDSERCVNRGCMIRVFRMRVREIVSICLRIAGIPISMQENNVIWDRGIVICRMLCAERIVLCPGAGMGSWIRGNSVMIRIC